MNDQTTITSTCYPGDHLAVHSIHNGEVHLIIDEVDYLAEPKRAHISVDPNKLRDAIDKAAGKREEDILFQDQVGYYHQIAMHPAFDDFWTEDSTPTGREMEDRIDAIIADRVPQEGGFEAESVESRARFFNHDLFDDCWTIAAGNTEEAIFKKLDRLAEAERAGVEVSKPYRPIDRDRLLRHIEDVQATITRRNERHEQDQERIRELEADLDRARSAVQVQVQRVKELAETKAAREYLDLAWDAAHVPADGMIREGEEFLCKDENGIRQPAFGAASHSFPANYLGRERRLLDPRPEPTEEDLYRKELEGKGLAEWEIELLTSAAS